MGQFRVNRPWILLRTWSKAQGWFWAEKVARGGVEVREQWGSMFPVFVLGVLAVLGSWSKFAVKVQKEGKYWIIKVKVPLRLGF